MTAAQDKLAAVERELKLRRRVFPRFVEAGRMSQAKADQEISIFEEIEQDYRAQARAERLL